MEMIENELKHGENVLWQGQPDPKKMFTKSDILLIPFSLLWGGFAIYWEWAVLNAVVFGDKKTGTVLDIIFPLFGMFFVIVGLYFIFGRFVLKQKKKKNTWYAVTDKRIIVAVNLLGQRVDTTDINTITAISKSTNSRGSGNVCFGNMDCATNIYSNTGIDFFYGPPTAPAFFDLKNAEEVYQIIQEQRKMNG